MNKPNRNQSIINAGLEAQESQAFFKKNQGLARIQKEWKSEESTHKLNWF